MAEGTLYGADAWKNDSAAALIEAERRIALVQVSPAQSELFLSDLFALPELPASLARCTHLQMLDVGDAFGPDGEEYRSVDVRSLSGWHHLAGLSSLQRLSLKRTSCADLAPLSGLTSLQSFDCSYTQISDLAPLSGLTALQELFCAGTRISDLVPLSGLTALQSLDCADTRISDLAPLSGLTALQSLDCADTRISDLAPLSGLTALQTLDCSGTQISDLAPLSGLTALQSFDCSGTQISDAAPLSGLTSLQKLYCWATQISDLVPLSDLTALQTLDCSGTQISDLAPLSGLTALQRLDCSDTRISDLAPLSGLTALQRFGCAGTQISDLVPLTWLTSLQSLDCADTRISDLAPLSGLTSLQKLYCWATQISDLVPLSDMTALQEILCSDTQISDLVPLSCLTALQTLDCSGTQISDLAPLSGLRSLQGLYCSGTQISDLVPLSGLTSLRIIQCSETQISDLAPLSGLTSLLGLQCSDTGVRDVACLKSCRALKSLVLNRCHLAVLPIEVIRSNNLNEIIAYEAHLVGIPDEVLSQSEADNCLPDLRAHLADLGDDPEPLGDVKLSVLGNGRIGKTQICNRLRDLPFEPNADSTHGIVLSTAAIPHSAHVFNIWDFGGQDIYHGTHALFLNSRAIFLLVWTPETDNHDSITDRASGMIVRNQKLDWWLDYVRRFGSTQSPLIVVQNQIDVTPDDGEHPAVVAMRAEREGGFCRSMGYSAKAKIGHPTLLDNLMQAVTRFNAPLIGKGRKAMIKHLRAVRAADERLSIEERKHRLMPLTSFEAECARIGGISSPRLFLQFLHNAGEVFWREGFFGDQIILDQAWVLEAVYTLFNREKCVAILTQQEGRFSADLLDVIVWGPSGYSQSEQNLFLQFMVSAGICFELRSASGKKYIAPDFLPAVDAEQGLIEINRSAARCLRFDSLPPLLLRNLISRVGERAGAHGRYWRNGVLFFDPKLRSRVLIEQFYTQQWQGEIRVVTEGGGAQKAMEAVITEVFEEAQRLGVSPKDDHVSTKDITMSAGPDPAKPISYYVSYAWNDTKHPASDNIEGVVDKLCTEANMRGIHIHRDKCNIKLGGRISEYMARLARGDRIIVILSDRYFKSRACMFELYEIWLQAKAEGTNFLEKVRIFTHPGTKIFTPVDRAKIAKHWADLYEEEKPLLDHMGGDDRVNHLALKKFAAHIGDILSLVADTLHPKNLDDLLPFSFDQN